MSRFIQGKILNFDEARKRIADVKKIGDAVLIDEINDDDFLYVEAVALRVGIPNANGDLFVRDELLRIAEDTGEPVYKSFIGCGVFVNHESDKVEKNIGKIFDAEYVDATSPNTIRLILGVDKKKAPDIVRGLQTGRLHSWSMGCSISYSICTHCGARINSEHDLCQCLKYHRGEMLDGVQVAEELHGVRFAELSCVNLPADIGSQLIQILATSDNGRMRKVAFTNDVQVLNAIYKKVYDSSVQDKMKIL